MSIVHTQAQAARELTREIKILDDEIEMDEARLTTKMDDRARLKKQLDELDARDTRII